jgi:catechol 2,3-dioxygenase-like lactoylglutathione lyase family enzyme
MNQGAKLIICPVSDVAQAKRLYGTLLGVDPYADTPYYIGFRVGDQEIGLDPHGHRGAGAVPYYGVDDVGDGKLVASVKDTDGNAIGLVQNP